jgi:hypothetical protein
MCFMCGINTCEVTHRKECSLLQFYTEKQLLNSLALVRKQTTLTERPPLVGEVSANLCR